MRTKNTHGYVVTNKSDPDMRRIAVALHPVLSVPGSSYLHPFARFLSASKQCSDIFRSGQALQLNIMIGYSLAVATLPGKAQTLSRAFFLL